MDDHTFTVCGIPCRLRTPRMREAVRRTLRQIRDRCPKDHADLLRLVREIAPLEDAEAADGTAGEWFPDRPRADDPRTYEYGFDRTPGVLKLYEGACDFDPRGLVAHELGHACTREEDRRRRGALWTDEWASEMAADWYAYKWGFGRIIARRRNRREYLHHGAAPGSTFSVGPDVDGMTCYYRVSRNFCVRLLRRRRVRRAPSVNSRDV